MTWKFLVFILIIFSISGAHAWSNTTFNNSLSSEFLFFNSSSTFTRYLSVPSNYGNIITAQINLTYPSLSSGLRIYYDFEASSEKVSGIYNLTANEGSVVYNGTDCRVGNCIHLSVNNNVYIPNSTFTRFNTSYTINYWVRHKNANSAGESVMFSPLGANGRQSAANQTAWLWNSWFQTSSTETARTPVQNNTYFMITITRNNTNGNVTIYINGLVEISGTNSTINTSGTSHSIVLGANGLNNASEMIGEMDELSIFDKQLSQSDINFLYNSGNGRNFTQTLGLNSQGTISLKLGSAVADFSVGNVTTNVSTLFTNLSSYINSYLSTCTFSGGYCNVPFNLSSTTNGVWILYNNLNFSNEGVHQNFYNSSSTETKTESFVTNFTSLTTISSAQLWYDGTSYSGSVGGGTDNHYLLSRTIDIPVGNGSKNWFWSVNYNTGTQQNLTTNQQNVSLLNLTLCGASPLNVPFLNFTFKDETSGSLINATNDLTNFDFWLGTGTTTKDYSTSSSLDTFSYAFCVSPPHETIEVDLVFKYSKTGYPLRTFQYDDKILTNTTTNQILYLLNSSVGIYSSIQVVDVGGAPVSGVLVTLEREISGSFTVIEQGVTDSSGLVTFWVNPNFDHRVTAVKTGYSTAQVTIRPSQSIYTLTLGSSSGASAYNSSVEGLRWIVYPKIGTIDVGTYNFNVTVTSFDVALENCKFELLNVTNSSQVLASDTSAATNDTYCFSDFSYTLSEDVNIFGRLSVDTEDTDGYIIVNSDWKWITIDIDKKSWRSISSFFEELKTLNEFGDTSNKRDFSRIVFFFLIATISIGLFTHFSGFEIQNPGISVIIIALIILFASAGGFLTFDSASDNVSPFIEQWGFFIIFLGLCLGYTFNTIRRHGE